LEPGERFVRRHPIVVAALVLGFIAAVWAAAARAGFERANRVCEIVVDYGEAEVLSASTGKEIGEILRRFAEVGVESAAISEQTLGELVASGSVFVSDLRVTAGGSGGAQAQATDVKVVNSADWYTQARVAYALATRLPNSLDQATAKELADAGLATRYEEALRCAARGETQSYMWGRSLRVKGYGGCEQAGMGLDLDKVAAVRAAGLRIVARPVNYPGLSEAAIDRSISDLVDLGVRTVIFRDEEVLGLGGLEGATARALADRSVAYGSVEFSKQEGDPQLRSLLRGEFVKVHSIETKEMPHYDPRRAADRFVLAASERGAGVLFVRLFPNRPGDPLETNLGYVASIASALEQKGWSLGPASPPDPAATPGFLRFLIGAGTAAGLVILLSGIAPLRAFGQISVFAVLAVVFGLLASVGGGWGKEAVAFCAAVGFPILGIVYARERLLAGGSEARWAGLGDALTGLVSAAVVSTIGGLFVAGLLFDRLHLSGVEQFRGVKLSLLVPILVVGALFVVESFARNERWGDWWSRVRGRAAGFLHSPTLIWQGAAVVVVLGVLAIAMTRSGNEPPFGVSSAELKLRTFLEHVFSVRPRSKEFLIGHPALALAFLLLLRGRTRFVAALAAAGALGQASIANTFAHIHTPVLVSLVRTVNGLVLGLVVAAIVCLVVDWYVKPSAPLVPRPETSDLSL
jgi:hypothetical protein